MDPEFLFVYGTLRSEFSTPMHKLIAANCVYVCSGFIHASLYEIDNFPGAIESASSTDIVKGELYKIRKREPLLSELDEYEGCGENYLPTPHYIRKHLPVMLEPSVDLPNNDSIMAWVYIYNRDVSNLRRIESGDYTDYL